MKPREKIALILTELIGEPVYPNRLYGAKGWYRTRYADVMPWIGYVKINNIDYTIGCWQTMSKCIKYGFVVYDTRGDRTAYSDFDVCAMDTFSGEKPENGIGSWQPKIGIVKPATRIRIRL